MSPSNASTGTGAAASGGLPRPGLERRKLAIRSGIDLDALDQLDLDALRSRWRAVYGAEPLQRLSRELMIRAIAYRVQEKARGGVSKRVIAKLERIVAGGNADGQKTRSQPNLRAGMRLMREWHEVLHEVIVVEQGFLWNGSRYGSLSEIARAITGTKWSGPRFFGLNGRSMTSGGDLAARSDAPQTGMAAGGAAATDASMARGVPGDG